MLTQGGCGSDQLRTILFEGQRHLRGCPPAHSASTALPLATALQLAAQGIPKGWTANMLHLQLHPPAIICDCVLFLLQVLCREL